MLEFTIKQTFGHWTIYRYGWFYGTADTKEEALREIEQEEDD